MKIVNVDRENLHIFRTTWGISMKFSQNIWLMIILKVTKNQGYILCLEKTFLEKPQAGGRGAGGGGGGGGGGVSQTDSPTF